MTLTTAYVLFISAAAALASLGLIVPAIAIAVIAFALVLRYELRLLRSMVAARVKPDVSAVKPLPFHEG